MAPAKHPAINAKTHVSKGSQPLTIKIALTAPPVAKLPSTVKSAKSNKRKVTYTPNAIMAHSIPWPMAPSIDNKIPIDYSTISALEAKSSGIVIPNCLAAVLLIVNEHFSVAKYSIGIVAGSSPSKISAACFPAIRPNSK